MRQIDRVKLLHKLVRANRRTVIVDVGANPFNGIPPYSLLRRSGLAHVVGFEPQPAALEALQKSAKPNDLFLPYAVGSGEPATLFVTKNSGLVSTLEPDPWISKYLTSWWRNAIKVREKIPIQTHRIDDISGIEKIDFLKIDIQGGELSVFQNARKKLSATALVQTEIPILRYYKNQPTFGDIQSELEAQGFLPHKFMETARHVVGYPRKFADGISFRQSQLNAVDLSFLRDPSSMDKLSDETLQHMTILADAVLQSFDLVLRSLGELVRRKIIVSGEIGEYVEALRATVFPRK